MTGKLSEIQHKVTISYIFTFLYTISIYSCYLFDFVNMKNFLKNFWKFSNTVPFFIFYEVNKILNKGHSLN